MVCPHGIYDMLCSVISGGSGGRATGGVHFWIDVGNDNPYDNLGNGREIQRTNLVMQPAD